MAFLMPPQIEQASQQVLAALKSVEARELNPLSTPWVDIEKSVIKLLRGPFQAENPEHQVIALGIAGFFGQRLHQEFQAFWFPNRESMEGAGMGFPEALIMLSPFGAVVDALRRARLEKLDDTIREIRQSLARVKFSASGGSQRLSAVDYARLFDPGFVSFVSLDATKAQSVWDGTPQKLQRDIQDALNRAQAKMPQELRQQFEAQIVGALQRLDTSKALKDQVERAPRVMELMAHLFATTQGTAAAPEELWQDVVFPLLHIGAPETFPPLDEEEVELAKKGVEPLYLYLEVVPYSQPASEQGLLGEFAAEELALPHASLGQSTSLRLVKLKVDRLKSLIAAFDAQKTRSAVARFKDYVFEKSGTKAQPGGEGEVLLDTAISLLTELKSVVDANKEVCLRRTTEAEAASEEAMTVVRDALSGPRIILA